MEPSQYNIVTIDDLPVWSTTIVPDYNIIVDNPEIRKSPFIYAPDLNDKISIWCVLLSMM